MFMMMKIKNRKIVYKTNINLINGLIFYSLLCRLSDRCEMSDIESVYAKERDIELGEKGDPLGDEPPLGGGGAGDGLPAGQEDGDPFSSDEEELAAKVRSHIQENKSCLS
jgi:hypothetical protein